MFRKFTVFTLLTIACFLLAGAVSAGELQKKLTRESTIEKILRSGTMRVGISTFVPWAMQDKQGNWVGFEIDVAKKLAADLGVEAEFIPTKWQGLIPALMTGKFDVIIAGMGSTTKRSLKINFTVPYDYSSQTICASKKNAEGFTGIEDFNKPEVTMLARLGTTSVEIIKKRLPKAKMVLFDDEGSMIQELLNGKAHGFVTSSPLPAHTAAKHGETVFALNEPLTADPIAFGVKKGDFDTLATFNTWIRNVESAGWLEEKRTYWWKTTDWESLIK